MTEVTSPGRIHCRRFALRSYLFNRGQNRPETMLFAPISLLAWVGVVLFTLIGLGFLAGTSRQSWFDPSTAIGIWLLGTSFILHGVFITGASTFGPIREMDVGPDPYIGGVA